MTVSDIPDRETTFASTSFTAAEHQAMSRCSLTHIMLEKRIGASQCRAPALAMWSKRGSINPFAEDWQVMM
jgi:hypothetical protein